jgi:hypothetical protein
MFECLLADLFTFGLHENCAGKKTNCLVGFLPEFINLNDIEVNLPVAA